MAGESQWWETWGGYVKLGGAVAGVAAVGIGGLLHRTVPESTQSPMSPSVYDLRVEQAAQDIKVLEAELRAGQERIQANAANIARLQAEMADLKHLCDERKERFNAVEAEGKRLAERQEHILDRLREVELKRGR